MIIYLVKSTLLLGLLFGVYKLLLENEKMHRFNRFFLLFALAFGLWAPLITFEFHPEQSIAGIELQQMERAVNAPAEAIGNSVKSVIIPKPAASAETETVAPPVTPAEPGWSLSATGLLFGLYGLITLVLFLRFAGGFFNILSKIKSGSYEKAGPATLVLLDEPTTPQSFFWFIFLDKKQFESREIEPEILDHELTHVRWLHSLDVLVVEFLKVILWFNPFIYLYKHAIQLNHEFIADDTVVGKGSSASDYQNMLIRVCSGNKPMRTTSSIGYSLTKKRLRMMVRSYSPFRSGSKAALLLPLLGLLTIALGTKRTGTDYLYSIPDKIYYSGPETYADPNRSEQLGIPIGAQFTSSGELFTGTKRVYYTENDSLYMEQYYEDGFQTESIMYKKNGDVIRLKFDRSQNKPHLKESYTNGVLVYKDILPIESEDGMGHFRMWHKNGQLAFEVSYTGDQLYQGLLTEYDEEGNIIMQERYEDGELVETIKERENI